MMKSLPEHLTEIRDGGLPILRKKIKNFAFRIIKKSLIIGSAPLAIPAVFLIRWIRPWIHIRLGKFINTDRIGHFVADVALAVAETELSQESCYSDWYFLPRTTCNQQWRKMAERQIRVRWWVELLYYWNLKFSGGEAHVKHPAITTFGSRDKHGWWDKSSETPLFLDEEKKEAKSWLIRQGWVEGELFVCMIVRDVAYLTQGELHQCTEEHVYYHNYRDSDISTYVQAAEQLADQGIWVLRMGKTMKTPIPTQHPKIIDYAFHSEQNDLLDIWLFAHCYFCLSTATGPDAISDRFRCPLAYVNASPLDHLNSWSNSLWTPKHLLWKKTGKLLTLKEHLEHGYFMTQDYEDAGIEIRDLTPEEITEAVQERLGRIRGTWKDTEVDLERQKKFWEILKAWEGFSEFHEWIHPEARVGTHYLRKMGDVFFE